MISRVNRQVDSEVDTWIAEIKATLVSVNQFTDSTEKSVTRNGTTYQQNTANMSGQLQVESKSGERWLSAFGFPG